MYWFELSEQRVVSVTEGVDRSADADRGGEAHAAGWGIPYSCAAATHQGRGEVPQEN